MKSNNRLINFKRVLPEEALILQRENKLTHFFPTNEYDKDIIEEYQNNVLSWQPVYICNKEKG